MKRLNKLRDELANKYSWPSDKDAGVAFSEGFDAATIELMQVIETQRKIIKDCVDSWSYYSPSQQSKAGKALTEARLHLLKLDTATNGDNT